MIHEVIARDIAEEFGIQWPPTVAAVDTALETVPPGPLNFFCAEPDQHRRDLKALRAFAAAS